ncbi:MAG: GIDE domain-containing protein, partial [Halobacteria archaeon]|nr:GIDE domain-containing protein [Halobacteria archaeon]
RYEVKEYDDTGDDEGWETIAEHEESVPFYLDDGTGEVLVNPEGAEFRVPVDNEYRVDEYESEPAEVEHFLEKGQGEGKEFFGINFGRVSDTNEDRRYYEYYVGVDDRAYVFGKALNKKDTKGSSTNEDNIVINEDDSTPMFMVSDRSEKELLSATRWNIALYLLLGAGIATAGFAGLLVFSGIV